MNEFYAVVLAGGIGTRLWPLSRRHHPKQFLDLTGEGSLLDRTVSRLLRMLPIEKIFVATVPEHAAQVRDLLPHLPANNLLLEPSRRGTGPCIGLAALRLEEFFPESTMLVVPADHIITDEERYVHAISTAIGVASNSPALVTIGLKPTHAATNYGYIKVGQAAEKEPARVYNSLGFSEKPSAVVAKEYYESGEYVWNAGTFSWSLPTLMGVLERFAPELAMGLQAIQDFWKFKGKDSDVSELYSKLPRISIDHALLEKADNVVVVLGQYQRIDLGDLNTLAEIYPSDEKHNTGRGKWISLDSSHNIVLTPGHVAGLVGIQDTIIISTDDAILVCPRDRSQEVGALAAKLGNSSETQHL